MTDQTAWPGKFDDVPLRVDPQREVETEFTGIYVRAMRDNIHGSYDIATLDTSRFSDAQKAFILKQGAGARRC